MVIKTLTDASIILDEIALSCSSFNFTPESRRRVLLLVIQFMCKSGKSLLRWLTFKHAHQSPGHLTHLSVPLSLTELLESISPGWESQCIKFCLQLMMSMSGNLIPDHVWQNPQSGLWTQGKLCDDVLSPSSHVVQLCAGCDWILAACQYPLVVWNYCKRKETPWWLRALSSTHDWGLGAGSF